MLQVGNSLVSVVSLVSNVDSAKILHFGGTA